MPGALEHSAVDRSILNAMRVRRRAWERRADEKLAILRRLQRQYVEKSLPKTHSETTVEQSFNEQLFATVLDYRTLLSHDDAEYHLRPKKYQGQAKGEPKRYDDFSLGFFSATRRVVIASAELKGPGASLDAKQTGEQYKGRSPVQQAFYAVKDVSSCRWVIVCNYQELRLYVNTRDEDTPRQPTARFNLLNVQNRDDLALLCAHFDRRAFRRAPRRTKANTPHSENPPRAAPAASRRGSPGRPADRCRR